MLSPAILNREFYSPSVPSTQITFPNCILRHFLHWWIGIQRVLLEPKKKVVYQRGKLFSIFFGWITLCYRGFVDFKFFGYSMFLCSVTSLCPCFVSMDGPSLNLCVRGCKRAVCFSVIGHLKEGAAQLESTLKVTQLYLPNNYPFSWIFYQDVASRAC